MRTYTGLMFYFHPITQSTRMDSLLKSSVLTDSTPISLSKCCLPQSLKLPLDFTPCLTWSPMFVLTKYILFPLSCSLSSPLKSLFCLQQFPLTNMSYTFLSQLPSSPHYQVHDSKSMWMLKCCPLFLWCSQLMVQYGFKS